MRDFTGLDSAGVDGKSRRMIVDQQKIAPLIARPFRSIGGEELRREGGVFFVGHSLPHQATLEAIFDSDCQQPVEIFSFCFSDADAFHRSEELVRLIKKNFKGYVLGEFVATPSFSLLDSAYAAGIDLIDLPLFPEETAGEKRLEALAHATSVFPRWATASSLSIEMDPPETTRANIDTLLERQILPLARVGPGAEHRPSAEIESIFEHLARGWRRKRAVVKPFLPLLGLTSPFAPPPRKGLVGSLFEKVDDARLRTTSDLRRLLRVKEVVESFESAGL